MSTNFYLNEKAIVTTSTSSAIVISDAQEDLIQRWVKFVDRSAQTTKSYTFAVKRFYRYLQDKGITEPTRQDVINYRDEMKESLKPASVKLNLNAVKLFFQWLASEGFIARDITFNIHAPSIDNSVHSRDALSANDAITVLNTMPADDSEQSLRNKAIMLLMICCGLRSIEVTRLDVCDLEKRRGKYVMAIWGKGRPGKVDSVILPNQVYAVIQKYLAARRLRGKIDNNAPLFTSTSRRCKNARLETQTISRLAKSALRAAGFDSPRLCCHSCRHSFANTALEISAAMEKAGLKGSAEFFNLRTIQQTLRHKSQAVTEIYLHDNDVFSNTSTIVVADKIFKGVVI